MTLIKRFKAEWQSLEGLDSPIVRWGSIFSVGILLWSFILMPYLHWRDQQQQQLYQKVRQISRLDALKAAAQDWQQAEQRYQEAQQNMVDSLFQQASYVTAQTALLELLRNTLKQHQLTLDAQRLLEAEPEPVIGQRIGITLNLHGELINVLKFIHHISQHPKLLTLDNLYMAQDRQKNMTVSLTITGYRLTRTNSQEEAQP